MKSIKLITILLLLQFTSFSQETNVFGRGYNDTLPESFKLDVTRLREHIYAGIADNLKEGDLKRLCFLFADNRAQYISNTISGGKIYSDWNSLENYVNDILRKVLPDELKNDSVIHAYIIRNGSFNAFMTPSGHILFNIGVFAEVNDEATIAAILAHELAHYYLRHSLKTFLQIKNGDLTPKSKSASRYSINQEFQSDSLSIRWVQNSGYDMNGVIHALELMQRLEKNELARIEQKWELKETTHPNAKSRLDKVQEFYARNREKSGKLFMIGEDRFLKFKNEAKPEILKDLLNTFNYYKCTETAFKFHLFDPDNGIYIYYLMESIRRNCYLNTDLWNKFFITDRYYKSMTKDNGKHYKIPIDEHLFVKFNFDVLPIDALEAGKINAKFYWTSDSPKFTTYKGAYEFFWRLSQQLNLNECLLSNALRNTDNKEKRDSLLKVYLSFPGIQHKSFAENLLASTLTEKLEDKKLLVYDQIDVGIMQGQEEITIRARSVIDKNQMRAILDSVFLTYPKYERIFLPNLKELNLNEYNDLYDLMIFSRTSIRAKGEKTELHILDPRFWEIFRKYNVNEIQFLNCYYYEMRKREKSVQAYKDVMNLDYNSIFNEEKCTKFFNVYVSGIRDKKDAVMKLWSFNGEGTYKGEVSLKFRGPGLPQMIEEVKFTLKHYDKKAEDLDYNYKFHPDLLIMY